MTDRSDALVAFEEMFNGVSEGRGKDNTDQAEEYGDSSLSEESFNDVAKKVVNDLNECESGHSLTDVNKVLGDMEEEEILKEAPRVEIVEVVKDDSDDDFDALPEEPKDLPEPSARFEEIVEKATKELAEVTEVVEHKGGCVVISNEKIKWNLDSPTALYNNFYRKKKELVEIYTGKQLDFYALNIELRNASVDISYVVFDQEVVLQQMQEIQQHRERIKNISLECNIQYFVWKRWIEKDMMKGYLAMVEYIKPAIKQEGLVLEHMRDLEYYYAQLEALHNNCQKVEKTLEAAYDTLSRRVSICMELKTGIRYARSDSRETPSKQEIVREDDFDDVPMGETATKKKSGFIGWA